MAVLISLRENLIADMGRPTTADMMIIDTAVVAYDNWLRLQGWLGNLSLIFEADSRRAIHLHWPNWVETQSDP